MKVYVLHDCIEDAEYHAEANVVDVSTDFDKLQGIMKKCYKESIENHPDYDEDESEINPYNACVVEQFNDYYFCHKWSIEGYEV